MLGTVVETPEDEIETPPTDTNAVYFREELQRFATRALRHELAELRSQLRQDLEEELKKLQPATSQWRPKGQWQEDSLRETGRADSDTGTSDSFLKDLDSPMQIPAPQSPQGVVCKPPGSPPGTMWAQERVSAKGEDMFEQNGSKHSFLKKQNDTTDADEQSAVKWGMYQRLGSFTSVRTTTFSTPPEFRRQRTVDSAPSMKGTNSIKSRRLSTLERASKQKKKSRMKSLRRAKSRSHMPFSSLMDEEHYGFAKKACILVGQFLESSISVIILFNGIFIGVQTDYQARNVTEVVPNVFPYMEIIFCIIFTGELIFKLAFWRKKFFTLPGVWAWNCFDFFLVALQLLEVIGMITSNHETEESSGGGGNGGNPVGNVSFLRLLRILRLFRVLRLVRLLHFIGELATIISSIANCFRALCWTVLLLLMMIYIVAIVITQVVFTHRVSLKNDGEADSPNLAKYWGSLGLSTLSLYQAILGGVDWEVVEEPMRNEIDWGPCLSIMFALYIAFTLLAVMNVITGTFVQSALQNAEKEKSQDFQDAAWNVFENEYGDPKITYNEFETKIDDAGFTGWLKNMGIEPTDAKLLFQLLDRDHLGTVDADKLVGNLVRLREGAKFMDIMKLMYEQDQLTQSIDARMEALSFMENFQQELTKLSYQVSETVLSQILARWEPEAGAGRAAPRVTSSNVHSLLPGSSAKAGDSAAGVPVADSNRPSESDHGMHIEEV